MESTTAVAIYAAVVSTATAGWNIWAGLRDRRPRLRMEVTFRTVVRSADGRELLKLAEELLGASLNLTVTNTGRRPITVRNWEAKYKRPPKGNPYVFFVTRHLPKTLRESESLEELNDDFMHVFETGIASMYVTDTSGRRWKLRRKDLKRIAAEYERLKAKNISTSGEEE